MSVSFGPKRRCGETLHVRGQHVGGGEAAGAEVADRQAAGSLGETAAVCISHEWRMAERGGGPAEGFVE